MARHYSTKDFFRQMPNALLACYFHERGFFRDLDFAAMKEGSPDALFAAWLGLPDSERNTMDAEFRNIFEMSCEKGFRAILDEAEFHLGGDDLIAFVKAMSALVNHYERAMTTFLRHHAYWRVATRFFHADNLPYWRKRKNFPQATAAVDEASIQQLARLVSNYFHHTEGRGKNCVVESFRRGQLDYFFAYPEDYSQQSIEWVDGEFDRRAHNPAFEVVFVYSQKDGSLDLNFRGSHKAIVPLQGMFAQAILKLDELPPDPKDERIYNLEPLLKQGFDFIHDRGAGIKRVTVKKLRLSSRIKRGDRITLEADTSDKPDAVYTLLDQLRNSLPVNRYRVTQVELVASVVMDGNKLPKTVTIRITYPNSCSLKYDELGLKLRDMLEASGIEPKEQAECTETEGPVET